MKKLLLAGVAVVALAGTGAVYARHDRPERHHHSRINPEDRAAFADAKIAAVKAGLRLSPDQEKLWPPVEGAVREFAKLRIDRANARMEARKAERRDDRADDAKRQEMPDNPVAQLQKRADDMAATAAVLKRIADAADPLYKTLDDGQKRRLANLTHMDGGPRGEGWRHGGRGFDRDNDRSPDRDGPRRFERDRDRGPGERL